MFLNLPSSTLVFASPSLNDAESLAGSQTVLTDLTAILPDILNHTDNLVSKRSVQGRLRVSVG